MSDIGWQWILLLISMIGLVILSPWARISRDFFQGSAENKSPNTFILTSSLVISWLFAKSIINAADLGQEFGIVGGFAYAGYYLSFVVTGIIIYQLRTKRKFSSIHHFLRSDYGQGAVIVFSVLIGFRLMNEIWSNTMVIGMYFGLVGSSAYYIAIGVFTVLTLLYTLKGGMRASIFTDVIQMILFVLLISIILMVILPSSDNTVSDYLSSGEWKMNQGINLLLVTIIQSLSYGFHDPVMTDRGFISPAKTTLKSFVWAGILGGFFIVLFSFIGIYTQLQGLSGSPTLEVSKIFGLPMLLMINVIMLTSAASTLDSTFSSSTKLVHLDLIKQAGEPKISSGRITMVILAILGTLPLFFDPEILSASTISGTMVIGLTPVFLFSAFKHPKISFHLSTFMGILFGLLYVFIPGEFQDMLSFGKYSDLLFINLIGLCACLIVFFLPHLYMRIQNYSLNNEKN